MRASGPREIGSWASNAALRFRASTGAVPSVPMATVTGSRSTMAGVMKSLPSRLSTMLTGDAALPGQRNCARILRGIVARAIEERRVLEVIALYATLVVAQCTLALPRQDVGVRVRAEYGDLRVGLQQQAQLGRRSLPGAGDDDALS